MMRATRNTYSCEYCGKRATSNRRDARFCSSACRTKAHRERVTGSGHTWHAVDPDYRAMATEIRNCSVRAYDAIYTALERFGATAAQTAIYAVYVALDDCLPKTEGAKA